MREIKFRYRLQQVNSGQIITIIYSQWEIELGQLWKDFYYDEWKVISRDQSTDLKDIDGREIYEGDIVGHYVKDFDGSTIESFRSVIEWWPNMVDCSKARVIGNIYSNPELLGEGKANHDS